MHLYQILEVFMFKDYKQKRQKSGSKNITIVTTVWTKIRFVNLNKQINVLEYELLLLGPSALVWSGF